MKVTDYLIEQAGINWSELLRPWSWLLPASFTLWLVNRFVDLFLVLEDGSVHVLRNDIGELQRLADSRTHFSELLGQPGNANDWLLIPLVDELVAAGLRLQRGQCYGFKLPPVVGGAYSTENVAVCTLSERIAFLADFYQQVKDVPDGSPVDIRVKNA